MVLLIDQYDLVNVEEAIWIKPKSGYTAKALILSFKSDIPNFIDIPGESMIWKDLEYIKQLLVCLNCLQFGHSRSVCRDLVAIVCRFCVAIAAPHNTPPLLATTISFASTVAKITKQEIINVLNTGMNMRSTSIKSINIHQTPLLNSRSAQTRYDVKFYVHHFF